MTKQGGHPPSPCCRKDVIAELISRPRVKAEAPRQEAGPGPGPRLAASAAQEAKASEPASPGGPARRRAGHGQPSPPSPLQRVKASAGQRHGCRSAVPHQSPPGSRGTRGESGLRTHAGPSGRRFPELSLKAGGAGSQRLPRCLGAQGPVLGVGRSCVLTPHDARSTDEETQVKGCVAHSECGTPRSCSTLAAVWPGTSGPRPSVSPSSSVKGVTPPPRLRGFPTRGGLGRAGRGEAGARSAPGPGPHRTPEQAGAGGLPPEPPEPRARRHRPAVRTPEPRHARPSAHAVPVCSRDTQSEPHARRRTHVAQRHSGRRSCFPDSLPRQQPPGRQRRCRPHGRHLRAERPRVTRLLPRLRPDPRSAAGGTRAREEAPRPRDPGGPVGGIAVKRVTRRHPRPCGAGGGAQKNVYRVPPRERQCKLVSTPRRRPRRERGRVTKPPPGTRAPGQRL